MKKEIQVPSIHTESRNWAGWPSGPDSNKPELHHLKCNVSTDGFCFKHYNVLHYRC